MQTEFVPGRTPAAVASIPCPYLRITVERCPAYGTLQVRLCPAGVPAGVPIGPRTVLEFEPCTARDLAALLAAQADVLESQSARHQAATLRAQSEVTS